MQLEIFRGPYQPALAGGFQIESCRLLTDISLRCAYGWTPFQPAIVDTGAPVSLLPHRFWQSADVQPLGRIRVGGISRRPECLVDVTLAKVVLAIRNPTAQIAPIEAHALLADSDETPTLIGMRGVFTDLVLYTNIAKDTAYIETQT